MLEHAFIGGVVPRDGAEIEKRLDEASKNGFTIHSWELGPLHARVGEVEQTKEFFFLAIMAKPIAIADARPTRLSGIRTGG